MAEVGLRDYQEAGVENVWKAFDAGERSALVVWPTGTGKTVLSAAVAARAAARKWRTLFLAHRGELLDQAAEKLAWYDLSTAVEKAGQRADPRSLYDDVVLAGVQTMQGDRLLRWPADHFDLVICDEAHHFLAPSFKAVLDRFPAAKVLGQTATPERGDGQKLGKVFGHLAHEHSMRRAILEGHLCRITIERPATRVDLSKVRTTCGDLNKGDLEDEIARHIEELVNAARERIGSRPTLVFTPDVGSATAFADGLRQVGVAARSVSGASPDRKLIIDQFKNGDFQALCNCMLLLEGFDHPAIAAVVMARPTKSGVLYRQCIGRGTRPSPETGKTDLLVVDFAWNSGRHDLVSPVELFDTETMDVEVQKIADELVRTGREKDALKAVDEAERIHKRNVALAVAVRRRESRYKFVAFDPFAIGSLLGIVRRHSAPDARPIEPGRREQLQRYQLEPGDMTDAQAKRLLKELARRRKAGLATHRQVAALVAKEVPAELARTLTFNEAKGDLDLLLGPTSR